MPIGAIRLYWPSWALATMMTGVVAGLMLGHALMLGRYLDWLLTSGRVSAFAETYPTFRRTAGALGIDLFYAVAGLQIAAGICFAVVSVTVARRVALGIAAGVTSVLWLIVHYASGFGALERQIYRSTTEVPMPVVGAFVAWNGPIHLCHAATLLVALSMLLAVPFTRCRNQSRRTMSYLQNPRAG